MFKFGWLIINSHSSKFCAKSFTVFPLAVCNCRPPPHFKPYQYRFDTQSKKVLRSTIMYEFMRDSLMLHYYSALLIFNCIPEVEKQIGTTVREQLIQHTYPELMVLRWAQEGDFSSFLSSILL